MKAYIPIDITDEMLVSSSIAEPDVNEPLYDPEETYAEFDQVSVISKNSHQVFESLADNNLGNDPLTTNSDVLQENAKWILRGNTNRFRMFDWNQGDPSVSTSPMTIVIRPRDLIDAIMLDGLKATLLELTVKNGIDGDDVYTLDADLRERNATHFDEYFFEPFVQVKKLVTFKVPPVGDPVIYITLSDPSGIVELSRLAVGLSTYLGPIEWNPISDTDNFSEIEWDELGRAKLTPVPSIPLAEVKLQPNANKTNTIRQFKELANAKAAVWSALDDLDSPYRESLIIFGVYENFRIDISNKAFTTIDLSLKGI